MEDTSKWQDRANQVAKCDFICLIFEAMGVIGMLVYGIVFFKKITSEDYFKHSDLSIGVVVTFIIMAIFAISLDCYAVKRLIIATKENSSVSSKRVLSSSRIWYYINVVVLVFAVLIELCYLEQTNILAFVFVVSIRVYMLYVIHRYIEDYKKIIGISDGSVYFVSGIKESSDI